MTERPDRDRLERIDLSRADDPRDVVHQAVASLAQGDPVFLSGEGVHGIAALAVPASPDRTSRWEALTSRSGSAPALFLRGADEVEDWIPSMSPLGRRFARRAWPGSVVLSFPTGRDVGLVSRLPEGVKETLLDGGAIAFRVCEHPFVRDVLRLVPGPVAFWDVPRSPPIRDDELQNSGIHLSIDANQAEGGGESTVVRVEGEAWRTLREGEVGERELTRFASTIFLFVCTGNTCRSPMAEAICKVLLAERLDCTIEELESRGFFVLSAGIAAMNGVPAAGNAVEVIQARGGSLREHASRKLTFELVGHADHILTMTSDHLDALLDHAPEAASKAKLLHPGGGDVADPIGADRETYRRTAAMIETYLKQFLDSLVY